MLSLQNPIVLEEKEILSRDFVLEASCRLPCGRIGIRGESPIQAREPETMALERVSKLSKMPVRRKILELAGERLVPTLRTRRDYEEGVRRASSLAVPQGSNRR